MTETPVRYRVNKRDTNCDTMADTNHAAMPLTPQERAFLLELRSGLLHGLVMIERKLGCESSVKTRAEKRGE